MNDTKFIHLLPTPTCVPNFIGTFVDENQELLVQSKAGTLANKQNFRIDNIFVDKGKFNELEDVMYSGQTVSNYLMLALNIDREENFILFYGRVLSNVDKLVLSQFISGATVDGFMTRKYNELLRDMLKLKPYMNAFGRKILESKYEENRKILDYEIVNTQLAALSHDLIFKYPNLSNKELNLSAYFALSFSTKEITAISGLTCNALRVHIYNICQKLNMQSRNEMVGAFLAIDYPGKFPNNMKSETRNNN